MKLFEKNNCRVLTKRVETHDVVTIDFIPESDADYSYKPGQYINIFLPNTSTSEGKSYSLSSAPREGVLSITVKRIGEFSDYLSNLKVGEIFQATTPYGFFFTESDTSELVLISGGIGIAPFRSMIINSPDRPIYLFSSHKTQGDDIFGSEMRKRVQENPLFHFYETFTRTGGERLNAQTILSKTEIHKTTEFFLCGSIGFVRDMWKGLVSQGIPEEVIYTEAFF